MYICMYVSMYVCVYVYNTYSHIHILLMHTQISQEYYTDINKAHNIFHALLTLRQQSHQLVFQ